MISFNTEYFGIISGLLVTFVLLINLMFNFYLFKFNKKQALVTKYNKIYFVVFYILSFISLALAIISLILFNLKDKIFSQTSTENQKLYPTIILNVISFVFLISKIIILFIFLPKFAIKITENEILYLGEKIDFQAITKIILDNDSQALYINYKPTKRTYKRIKYSNTCSFKQLILDNSKNIKLEISNQNANEYFKKIKELS
ncbi:hypothetical protein [Mycoplasma leachii]|uniref:Putative transmembrane protein n=1 Tax=Mycoplasma leachii 06049 TaxID=1188244 RepID=A0A2T4I911_9MOLU|nr:hypothetical protein [Mycoplasma leachii]PTD30937.1 putative transmembrane protein [Mycoplasma leachii 06049]